jgi:hypothetical protein
MTKVSQPCMSESVSGSVSGISFCSYRGTNYVKKKSTPGPLRSQVQFKNSALLADLSRYWSLVTTMFRTKWNEAAGPNESGYELFMNKCLTASRVQGRVQFILAPTMYQIVRNQIPDFWIDSGILFYENDAATLPARYFDIRVLDGQIEGKKVEVRDCNKSFSKIVVNYDIVETPIYCKSGFTYIYSRNVDPLTGNVSIWTLTVLQS